MRLIARCREPHISLKGRYGLSELSEDSAGISTSCPKIALIDTTIAQDVPSRKLWGTH